MTLVDFANEGHAWNELTFEEEKGKEWLFHHETVRPLFTSAKVRKSGFKWYEHPEFKEYNYKKGMDRISLETDKFFAELGYEHIPFTGKYRVIKPNDERVALLPIRASVLLF